MAKIERTKNATRNIIYGSLLRAYQIIVPFLMRTAMIYLMGVQYLGLNSLFASVLQVLNMAELGVGSAMVYSMYRPIAEDDTVTICALIKLYRTYYRVIGLIIAVIGGALTPFIPNLIKGTVPSDINIRVLYLLNLGATVLSYWMFAYKNSVLQAYQRVDIVSRVDMFTSTIQYSVQLLVLWLLHNYYYYVLVMLLIQVLQNILTYRFANKLYPEVNPEGKLSKESVQNINGRIKDLFTAKLGSIIVNSADTIVISAFLGLEVLAVYQNYYFILSAIMGFVTVLYNSILAGIGNSLVTETKDKNYKDFLKFTFLICWISGVCACCFLNLYQPFMRLWVGQKYILEYSIVVCLVIYFYICEINQLLNAYKDAAGIWHSDRFRPLTVALSNLGLNLVMVKFIGLYGIVLSTVLSTIIIGMPWLLHNVFTYIFDRSQIVYYVRKLFTYTIVVIISCLLSYILCLPVKLGLIMTVIIRGVICCVVPNVIYILVYKKHSEYNQMLNLLNIMTKGHLHYFLRVLGLKSY